MNFENLTNPRKPFDIVYDNVLKLIAQGDKYPIEEVCDYLCIWDWFSKKSITQNDLSMIKNFMDESKKEGYDSYIEIKVGEEYYTGSIFSYKVNPLETDTEDFYYDDFRSIDD